MLHFLPGLAQAATPTLWRHNTFTNLNNSACASVMAGAYTSEGHIRMTVGAKADAQLAAIDINTTGLNPSTDEAS